MAGVHLINTYGVKAHHRAGPSYPPFVYVPTQSWWSHLAGAIIHQALKYGDILFLWHPYPFAKLQALIDQFWWGDICLSHGLDVPKELPEDMVGNPAWYNIFSGLAIKLA